MAPTTTTSVENAKKLITVAASVATTVVLVRSAINDFLPVQVQDYIKTTISNFFSFTDTNELTIVIEQVDGVLTNELYEAASLYLSQIASTNITRFKASKQKTDKKISLKFDSENEIVDEFEGIPFRWTSVAYHEKRGRNENHEMAVHELHLRFHWKHKDTAVDRYLPFVLEKFKAIQEADKSTKLNMLCYNDWTPVNLDHPSTFDTLALDPELKGLIISDLNRFLRAKDYYRKVGKAWKRGYLLYGPPGTGKSSLIAAMANYLKYDIYDLELTEVCNNTDLRTVIAAISNKSIIVVEDIDCTIKLQNREGNEEDGENHDNNNGQKVTLSGVLNAIDGLWSCCGEERIIVFTTNHKDRLDPALIRPGRMDMHVHMSYCTPAVFRELVSNYHSVVDHVRFPEIEELIREVEVTPAEVAGELMRSDDDVNMALGFLSNFLQDRKKIGKLAEAA